MVTKPADKAALNGFLYDQGCQIPGSKSFLQQEPLF